jgi:glucose-6-phosphate-specific signal transduction histidine kinase
MIDFMVLKYAFQKTTPNDWFQLVIYNALIIIVFSLGEVQLFRFSVGIRVTALLLFPFRYWPALIIGGVAGQFLYQELYLNMQQSIVDYLNKAYRWTFNLPYLFSLLMIAFVKVKLKKVTIEKLRPLLIILCTAIFYRIVSSTFLLINSTGSYYGTIPPERKFELILTHFLGGFVGIVLILPLGFLINKIYQYRANINWFETFKGTLQISALIISVAILYSIQPHTLYLLKILAIFPLVWFAYRFGWVGAISSGLVINGLILVSVFAVNQTEILIENQFHIIIYAFTSMLLGALMSEQKAINKRLAENNETLNNSNKELLKLSEKNKKLANKVISIQEEERKKLSHELHDEVGQNVTALKVELKVLEHSKNTNSNAQPYKHLNTAADRIYDSVYRVMHWLRPRVLDDLGLKESISGEYFSHTLSIANIEYQCAMKGNVDRIKNEQAITIFRIAQECVNNCIRHSQANNFYLLLDVKSDVIELSISDDGHIKQATVNDNSQGGFGLLGIEERIQAANGTIDLNNTSGSFSMKVVLPR